jgi:hypothetical protein
VGASPFTFKREIRLFLESPGLKNLFNAGLKSLDSNRDPVILFFERSSFSSRGSSTQPQSSWWWWAAARTSSLLCLVLSLTVLAQSHHYPIQLYYCRTASISPTRPSSGSSTPSPPSSSSSSRSTLPPSCSTLPTRASPR